MRGAPAGRPGEGAARALPAAWGGRVACGWDPGWQVTRDSIYLQCGAPILSVVQPDYKRPWNKYLPPVRCSSLRSLARI